VLPSNRTEADFKVRRDQRDRTAQKYALWEAGERLPSQRPNSIVRWICGKAFDQRLVPHFDPILPARRCATDSASGKLLLQLATFESGPKQERAASGQTSAAVLSFMWSWLKNFESSN
jgi:hypothetical protein